MVRSWIIPYVHCYLISATSEEGFYKQSKRERVSHTVSVLGGVLRIQWDDTECLQFEQETKKSLTPVIGGHGPIYTPILQDILI